MRQTLRQKRGTPARPRPCAAATGHKFTLRSATARAQARTQRDPNDDRRTFPLAGAAENRSKLLDPFSHVDFAHVHVSPCIDPDCVREGHLAGEPATAAEIPEGLAVLPLDNPDDVVMRVRDEEILLLRVL